jgi:hypothetical protein
MLIERSTIISALRACFAPRQLYITRDAAVFSAYIAQCIFSTGNFGDAKGYANFVAASARGI